MPSIKETVKDLDFIEVQAISYKEAYNRKAKDIFYTYETKLEFEGRMSQAVDKLISGAVNQITI